MKTVEMIIALTVEIPDEVDEGDMHLDVGKLDHVTIAVESEGKPRQTLKAKVVWYETEVCYKV